PYLLVRRLLHRELPRTAPAQCPEPDFSVLLIGVRAILLGSIDREPRIGLMACGAAPALQHFHARVDFFLDELRLSRPSPVQIAQTVAVAARYIPGPGLRAFECQRLRSVV